jgi:hypothetical protein
MGDGFFYSIPGDRSLRGKEEEERGKTDEK